MQPARKWEDDIKMDLGRILRTEGGWYLLSIVSSGVELLGSAGSCLYCSNLATQFLFLLVTEYLRITYCYIIGANSFSVFGYMKLCSLFII